MRLQNALSDLIESQVRLSSQVIIEDMFDVDNVRFIGGADVAYSGEYGCGVLVVYEYPGFKLVDKAFFRSRVSFPYIPGFLSFRELPFIKTAYEKVHIKPDLLFINGNGILHFRFFGLASHTGVVLGVPTIGVSQNLLCGVVKKGKVYYRNRLVGYEYTSRRGCRPIYVSPGHNISLKTALSITKSCIHGHKLPEPLHVADKMSKSCISKYQSTRFDF
ncbi:MAG: endonuclease V [Candidatus Micrarchaeia archaeon]